LERSERGQDNVAGVPAVAGEGDLVQARAAVVLAPGRVEVEEIEVKRSLGGEDGTVAGE